MASTRRSPVEEDHSARWVAVDPAGGGGRPEAPPSFELWLAERRERRRVWFERSWLRRQRRRYRRAIRRHEAAMSAWRRGADGDEERWRFVCSEAERTVSAAEYRALLDAQGYEPCLVLETLEGDRWWMFRDRVFVSTAELESHDVAAELTDALRPRRPAGANGANGAAPGRVRNGDVPAEVRRYVQRRDRGRCAACGDDGPELRVDPATLRLVCGDCLADGWTPAPRLAPPGPAEPPPPADGHARHNGAAPRRSERGARPAVPRSRRRRSRRDR